MPLAQESAARAVAQQSISVGGKGKQDRSTSYRSAHGTNHNPEDAPWAQGSTGRGATRLLLGLGLQLRATHAGGREALIDAYDLAESGRGAEIRARLFGRHGRGAGTGAETRKRANGLSISNIVINNDHAKMILAPEATERTCTCPTSPPGTPTASQDRLLSLMSKRYASTSFLFVCGHHFQSFIDPVPIHRSPGFRCAFNSPPRILTMPPNIRSEAPPRGG